MARARKNDLHTSHKAAEKVEPRVSDVQREILAYFVHRRCMTDWDLEEHFRDHGSTYRTRRGRAHRNGLHRQQQPDEDHQEHRARDLVHKLTRRGGGKNLSRCERRVT